MRYPVLRIRINQRGSDSKMWYKGMIGREFMVELCSCAMGWDDEYLASGWAQLRDLETKNSIDLTDCEILEQMPNLVKMNQSREERRS